MKTLTAIIFIAISLKSIGGEISDYYFQQLREHPRSSEGRMAELKNARTYSEISSTNHGITEIGIERTGCFGTCPSYTFIVRSDGSFRYSGGIYAKRTGDFSGTIPYWDFHELAQFIRDSDYMNLGTDFRASVTDLPTTFTMVVIKGKKKVISDYGGAGPTKLWAIEHLIDDLMSKGQWKPLSKPKNQKK